MKRVTVFLLGIILIALTTMSIFLAGTIFDTGKKIDVETYFFQPGNTDLQRPGKPISPAAVGTNEMRDLLINPMSTFRPLRREFDNPAQHPQQKTHMFHHRSSNISYIFLR